MPPCDGHDGDDRNPMTSVVVVGGGGVAPERLHWFGPDQLSSNLPTLVVFGCSRMLLIGPYEVCSVFVGDAEEENGLLRSG